ncbi:MAG: hypothetical protein Q8R47_05975 [Nanoarchaeota archaeon]|nr:hypothetical protein [Nanoarchaeota archaeon]
MELKEQFSLEEYKAAQESAQHHDKGAWNRFYLLGGGMLILFGFLVKENEIQFIIKFALAIFGLIISFILIFIHDSYAKLIAHKYKVCKDIERDIKKVSVKGNHNGLRPTYFKNYFMILMICFILLWGIYLFSLIIYDYNSFIN